MRITNALFKQHKGWLQKLKWKIQGRRKIYDDGIAKSLESQNLEIKDATVEFGL